MAKVIFHKRKLHDDRPKSEFWLSKTPEDRLAAVEFIRQTANVEQEFPRVYRISRRKRIVRFASALRRKRSALTPKRKPHEAQELPAQKKGGRRGFIKAFQSFGEAEAWDIAYWNAQTPQTRLRVAEQLRRQLYGEPPKEFPKVLVKARRA